MPICVAACTRGALRMATGRRHLHEELRSVEGGRLNVEETVKAVAIPPVEYNKCHRVEHFLAAFTGPVRDVVSVALQLPEPFIEELIRFGAVYTCPVIPDTAPTEHNLSPVLLQELAELREEAVRRVGRHPEFRQPRRVTPDTVVHQHSYCRVHVHPKRFPAYYQHDWSRRIVLENAHCVIVNKPPGCQVPPRVDNQLECLTHWVGRLCGIEAGLKPVHRLDTGTEGLVVLAKTTAFARYFQTLLLGEGLLEKGYRALTHAPPPLGLLRHYVEGNHHVKGQPRRSRVFSQPTPCAVYAELEVLQTERVPLAQSAREKWGVAEAYESTIALKTGRTHQIRVQLTHEGFPLLGDDLYPTVESPKEERIGLGVWDACLGLQAATLTMKDTRLREFFPERTNDMLSVTAGAPWWRNSRHL